MESGTGNVLLRRLFGKNSKKSHEDLANESHDSFSGDLAGSSTDNEGQNMGQPIGGSSSTSIVLKDADSLLQYLKRLNLVTEDVSAKQNRKWSDQESSLHQEAERLETQYREVEATLKNIAVVKNQLKAVKKDQRNMATTIDALQRQEEAVMEAEIRKFEEGLLSQYRKSLFSGECKMAELEALQATVSHKKRALELLDELISRALTMPTTSDANALSLKAVARRGARIPAARTEALRAHARARRRDRDIRAERAAGIHGFSAAVDSTSDLPRPDTSIRTLFGDLFTQTGHEEPEIIPLTYFETSV